MITIGCKRTGDIVDAIIIRHDTYTRVHVPVSEWAEVVHRCFQWDSDIRWISLGDAMEHVLFLPTIPKGLMAMGSSDVVYKLPPVVEGDAGDVTISALEGYRKSWAADYLGIPDAWLQSGGAGVRVAVLDTGVDATHPDMRGKIGDTISFVSTNVNDLQGHGTHCASTIAADGVYKGIARSARLLIGKILNDDGSGTDQAMADGIRWAADKDVQIISISAGGPNRSQVVQSAVDYAVDKGVMVIVSAGNSGGQGVTFPARHPGVLAVGAHDQAGKLADFSSIGPEVDVVAPGVNILACYPVHLGRYKYLSGTSMAAPTVGGVVAIILGLLKAKHGRYPDPREVMKMLASLTDDRGQPGHDPAWGHGVISVRKISEKLQGSDVAQDRAALLADFRAVVARVEKALVS